MSDETMETTDDYLSPIQVRVIACLMEKHLATPKNYPLTPNSLTLACNQKTNRAPVMNLTEGQVMNTVNALVAERLVYIDHGSRTKKISHRGPGSFELNRKQQAILCMLMLREPLTLNDIKARTERMVQFESVDEIQENLDELISRPKPLITLIPKGNGRREERYTHLLAGIPDVQTLQKESAVSNSTNAVTLEPQKIQALEARIQTLEEQVKLLLAQNNLT